MARLFTSLLVSLAIFSISHAASATQQQINADFEALKTLPQDYQQFGNICEQVARLRVQEQYAAPQYEVVVGIGYDGHGRTLGELDVVVFRSSDNEAILVGEVKCWKNLDAARAKAESQLRRFEGHINGGSKLFMYTTEERDRQAFFASQFDESPQYITVSQDGGEDHGFDMTLGLNMAEVIELRDMLIHCQAQGKCPKGR